MIAAMRRWNSSGMPASTDAANSGEAGVAVDGCGMSRGSARCSRAVSARTPPPASSANADPRCFVIDVLRSTGPSVRALRLREPSVGWLRMRVVKLPAPDAGEGPPQVQFEGSRAMNRGFDNRLHGIGCAAYRTHGSFPARWLVAWCMAQGVGCRGPGRYGGVHGGPRSGPPMAWPRSAGTRFDRAGEFSTARRCRCASAP